MHNVNHCDTHGKHENGTAKTCGTIKFFVHKKTSFQGLFGGEERSDEPKAERSEAWPEPKARAYASRRRATATTTLKAAEEP